MNSLSESFTCLNDASPASQRAAQPLTSDSSCGPSGRRSASAARKCVRVPPSQQAKAALAEPALPLAAAVLFTVASFTNPSSLTP